VSDSSHFVFIHLERRGAWGFFEEGTTRQARITTTTTAGKAQRAKGANQRKKQKNVKMEIWK